MPYTVSLPDDEPTLSSRSIFASDGSCCNSDIFELNNPCCAHFKNVSPTSVVNGSSSSCFNFSKFVF